MTVSEYPEPTVSTVKRLYARALRCAKPGCSRPLYAQNNDTGDLVLNSRIAHIHARRHGGPRWTEMSAEDNRGEANLLLLCIEHSYEVDEFPDRYPAESLREWKRAQLDEYEHAQRGWPLSDAEAGRVLGASSAIVEHHHAEAVLGAVRAVQRLDSAARDARRGPVRCVAQWRAARARARATSHSWDQDGNSVYAEPSRLETERHRAALNAALQRAAADLQPIATDVKVELAAVRASRPAIEPWSSWVSRTVDEVVAASSAWADPAVLEHDDQLDGALTGLKVATDALTAAWRGDPTAALPPEPVPEPPPAGPDPLLEHQALLDRARPYARVHHRPYDAALRADLSVTAERAASIPPVPSALAIGLSATSRLAAAVAANASDEELTALAEQDLQRRPLSVAFLLLAEAAQVAEARGRPVAQGRAEAALVALWNSVGWADAGSWDSDDANCTRMLWAVSGLTSTGQVSERLSDALTSRPDIVLQLVEACAGWAELQDREDGRVLGFRRRYRELPAWFPVQAVVSAASAAVPDAGSVAVDEFGETVGDDAKSLLAQVLWLARRASP